MKNLVLLFAAVVAVSFASCGNSTETTEETVDSSMVIVETPDTVAVDTTAADTVAAAL